LARWSCDARAPYLMQSALEFERQLPRNTTVAITCRSHALYQRPKRGLHMTGFQVIIYGRFCVFTAGSVTNDVVVGIAHFDK
jgi:hypothetical protein